jgi:hypothetical protein
MIQTTEYSITEQQTLSASTVFLTDPAFATGDPLLLQQPSGESVAFHQCFMPDVAGDYHLQLIVTDNSRCKEAYSSLKLTAKCPALTANWALKTPVDWTGDSYVDTPKVTLSRSSPRRVILDATGSIGNPTFYFWYWNVDKMMIDPTVTNIQYGIENAYSSKAALSFDASGNTMPVAVDGSYYLKLYISDGCSASTVDVTIQVMCAENPGESLVLDGAFNVTDEQSGSDPVQVDATGVTTKYTTFVVSEVSQQYCAWGNEFELTQFTEQPGVHVSGVGRLMPWTFALVILAFVRL